VNQIETLSYFDISLFSFECITKCFYVYIFISKILSTSVNHDFQIVILTNRLSDSIISDIYQSTQNHQIDKKVRNLNIIT